MNERNYPFTVTTQPNIVCPMKGTEPTTMKNNVRGDSAKQKMRKKGGTGDEIKYCLLQDILLAKP